MELIVPIKDSISDVRSFALTLGLTSLGSVVAEELISYVVTPILRQFRLPWDISVPYGQLPLVLMAVLGLYALLRASIEGRTLTRRDRVVVGMQAGLTAGFVGRLLDVRLPGRDGVAILSVNSHGLALADALRAAGRPVCFIDSSPQQSRAVEEAGHAIVFGNGLQERTLARAHFESVDTAVAMTGNDTLNGVFLRRAHELFGVPQRLVASRCCGRPRSIGSSSRDPSGTK